MKLNPSSSEKKENPKNNMISQKWDLLITPFWASIPILVLRGKFLTAEYRVQYIFVKEKLVLTIGDFQPPFH